MEADDAGAIGQGRITQALEGLDGVLSVAHADEENCSTAMVSTPPVAVSTKATTMRRVILSSPIQTSLTPAVAVSAAPTPALPSEGSSSFSHSCVPVVDTSIKLGTERQIIMQQTAPSLPKQQQCDEQQRQPLPPRPQDQHACSLPCLNAVSTSTTTSDLMFSETLQSFFPDSVTIPPRTSSYSALEQHDDDSSCGHERESRYHRRHMSSSFSSSFAAFDSLMGDSLFEEEIGGGREGGKRT